jgi:hypothetical protein
LLNMAIFLDLRGTIIVSIKILGVDYAKLHNMTQILSRRFNP